MNNTYARALVAALIITSQSASATSCGPLSDRYFFRCSETACVAAFHVEEVGAFGMCGRRTRVSAMDPKVVEFLGPVAAKARPRAAVGIFEVHLERRYWHRATVDPFGLLQENLAKSLRRYDEKKDIAVAALAPLQLVELLNKHYGAKWFAQVGTEATDEAVRTERKRYESVAMKEFLVSTSLRAAYWLSFLIVLLAFIHSVHLYFSRLYARNVSPSLWRFATPLAIQFVVALLGGVALFASPFDFWPGSLLLPAAITVLIAEGWARFRSRHVT